jgi:hypothetical protein
MTDGGHLPLDSVWTEMRVLIENLWDVLDQSVSPFALANLCYYSWREDFKCVSLPASWLIKDAATNEWRSDAHGVMLRMRISTMIPLALKEAMNKINKSLARVVEEHKRRRLLRWRDRISRYLTLIYEIPFKKDIMEECAYLFLRADDKPIPDILAQNNDVFA